MLTFSLIVSTITRTTEVEYLLGSISSQRFPGLECIVVDQNGDRRVKDIADRWNSHLKLQVIESAPGLSRARNVGLPLATGDILAFPDDDCWYSESLLANVSNWFESHPKFDILTVGAKDLDGTSSGNRWVQDQCELRPSNVFRTTFSSTIFLRRTPATQSARFDESLGVGSGTCFGCGEETDYVLRLLQSGIRGYFDRTWHIGHPKRDMLSGHVDGARAAGYGTGMGHVLRKRSHPLLAAAFVAYDVVRSMIVSLKGDWAAASLCLKHAQGIATGYLAK
jgi:glycosyltransferase involved in cell wall biosynthesis